MVRASLRLPHDAPGGVRTMLLTHQDGIADQAKWHDPSACSCCSCVGTTAILWKGMLSDRPRERGAGRTLLLSLLALVAVAILVGGCQYNSLVTAEEGVRGAWSEIDNQYRRRADLVPNLVETVKGAADFERSTLEAVVQARAAVGRAQMPTDLPTDPAQLEAYLRAQQQLGGALARLLVVAEQYPQLRATENFRSLQDQLEGTENRIAVARRDYIDRAREFNTRVRRFPANVFAGMFGFEPAAQFAVEPAERTPPKVEFGAPGKK